MDPIQTCRMFKSKYPKDNSIVMAQVTEIGKKCVTVALLEYNSIKGRLMVATDPSCVRSSVLGRIEPLVVTFVDKAKEYILLNRSSLTFEEKYSCEREFNKRKYVQSVLVSVAEDRGMVLKDLYKLTRWPSYDDLKTLDKARWLKKDLGAELSTFLLARIKLMKYWSWRIEDPSILRLFLLIQKIAVCWAFALVMQLEAYLKLKKRLPRDAYLSVQDLINKVPKHLLVGGQDGDIDDLKKLAPVLRFKGIVREEMCPLTNSLTEEPREDMGTAYKVRVMKLHNDLDFPEDSEEEEEYRAFFDMKVAHALETSPVCASVVWFDSYAGVTNDILFKPTAEEQRAYEEDGAPTKPVHTMLLTGHGVDRNGEAYFEFQDCNGDVNNGDRGYVRFRRFPNPIIEYVQLKI